MKILVIGGGLFGCSVAIELARNKSFQVTIVEKEFDIMMNASKVNHNRLHLGYHYLRSIPTAVQSIEGLLSFMFNYGEAVITQFPNYYAIAKKGSKTSADEFIGFCHEVGIGYDDEFPDASIMNREKIEASFKVPEPIFDYDRLKSSVKKSIGRNKIELRLNTHVKKLEKKQFGFSLELNGKVEEFDVVVNSTYVNVNYFTKALNLPEEKLLFEDVVIPFFLYPSNKFGLTIMDGEFCSVMPKGSNQNEFLLYHVKYSVLDHCFGYSNQLNQNDNIEEYIRLIYEKSSEFYPFLKKVNNFGRWRTIRTVHENNSDARVTELFSFDELDNYFVILSGKISTCMQVALRLRHILEGKESKKGFKI
jgi:FAD dependent oxidoreductase